MSCKNCQEKISNSQGSSAPLIDKLMTVQELAEFLATTPGVIYDRVYRRVIPFIKVGRSVRFRRSEIERWLSERSHHVD